MPYQQLSGRMERARSTGHALLVESQAVQERLQSYRLFAPEAIREIDPGLLAQLRRYIAGVGADLPAGAALTFLRCWVHLYGMVSLEVFEHLHFALDDAAPMFEITLTELADLVGLDYPPAR